MRCARYVGLLFLLLLLVPSAATASPPLIRDDLQYKGLATAIDHSISYLQSQPEDTCFPLLDNRVSREHLIRSLQFFRELIQSSPSPELLSLELQTYFDFHEVCGPCADRHRQSLLVTGYYQPVFAGSLTRQPPYIYPLYGIPDNLVQKWNPARQKMETGRLSNGRFLPYWTRAEIEQQGHARGFELVYLKDPFDAFLLHVQGSGLIRLRDGSLRAIHYALKNGRPYKSIGKFMIRTGRLPKKNQGIASIRQYLDDHPDEVDEILHVNPSFIFFAWSLEHSAVGNLGRPLTAHRSVAVDQHRLPAGGLALLQSSKPDLNSQPVRYIPFSRFVLAQDTGSAIKGTCRLDLFWGTGNKAGRAAGMMKQEGKLFFLLLKKKFLPACTFQICSAITGYDN